MIITEPTSESRRKKPGRKPEHWGITRIKFVAGLNPSKRFSDLLSNESHEVVFLPMERVSGEGSYDQSIWKPISELRNGFTYFERNDIIVAKITPCFENGKAAILESLATPLAFGSTEFHVLRASNLIDRKFLWYVIRAHRFRSEGEAFMSGVAGQKRVPESYLADFLVSLPPLPEQRSIARFLDDKTAKIDRLIEKKRRLIKLLKEERQAVINHAVTKGLNPNAKMKPSGIEWLEDVPVGWEVKKLKYVAESVKTGSTPPSDKQEYYEDGDFDWFTPSDFEETYMLRDSNRKVTNLAVEVGAVRVFPCQSVLLVSIGATLGKLGIIEQVASSNQQINAIAFHDSFNPYFGLFYLQSIAPIIVSLSNASTLAILNQGQTKVVLMLVPSRSEQDNIVQRMKESYVRTDTLISKAVRAIELLTEYRTALITEAVTGKINFGT